MDRDRLFIFGSAEAAAAAVADRLAALASETKTSGGSQLIGLATGQTMAPVYAALLEQETARPGLFAGCRFSQLDEYLADPTQPGAQPPFFADELNATFFSQLTGGFGGFLGLDGQTDDPAGTAAAHRRHIAAAGGLAVQLLGIGVNGHIGFNEPGTATDSICRVVELADSTVARAGLAAGSRAITLGIADILEATEILLLATGPAKAATVAAMITGPQSPACPASLLRDHPNFCIVLDEQAARLAEID